MKCDGLILDVDGTIWNTTPLVAKAWNKVIEEKHPEVPRVTAEILQGQFGKTMKTISDNLFGILSEEERKVLIDACAEQEQKELSENQTDITYSGVLKTIKELSDKVPLFIVSNCQSGYIELVMEKNQIQNYITDFECYGDTLKEKYENIQLICQRNNLKNPVYVGDTQGDCDSCNKAGVPFIWATYGFGTADNYVAKISSFPEIVNCIDLYNK